MAPSRSYSRVGLAIGGTDAGARPAADASSGVRHNHHLALDLIVFITVEIDHIAVLIDALEGHHLAPADFVAAAAADASAALDSDQVFRLPRTPVASCGFLYNDCHDWRQTPESAETRSTWFFSCSRLLSSSLKVS